MDEASNKATKHEGDGSNYDWASPERCFLDDQIVHTIRQDLSMRVVEQGADKPSKLELYSGDELKAQSTALFEVTFVGELDTKVAEQVIEHLAEKAEQMPDEILEVFGYGDDLKGALELTMEIIASMKTDDTGSNYSFDIGYDTATNKVIQEALALDLSTIEGKNALADKLGIVSDASDRAEQIQKFCDIIEDLKDIKTPKSEARGTHKLV